MSDEASTLFVGNQVDDLEQLSFRERVEADDLVDPVEELRAEEVLERPFAVARAFVVRAGEAHAGVHSGRGAEVAGHDHDGVAEVDGASLAVGDTAVVEDLQEQVEDVGVGLLDLVEQDDAEGSASDQLGQAAAVVVADVAGRRADDAADGVALLVLGHVEPDQRVLGVEQVLGQGLGELGLADAGRSDEDERADRAGRDL